MTDAAMTGAPAALDAYDRACNEVDPGEVAAHLEGLVTDDVVFADPANRITGADALVDLIVGTRGELPTAQYVLTSDIDGTTLSEDGRIERIDGFFGALVRREALGS